MKNQNPFVYLLIFIFSFSMFAQKDTIWYDSNWNNTKKEQASYFRPEPVKKDNGYLVVDYFLSGTKQMEAFSLEPNDSHFQGNVIYYFEDGNILQEAEYKNGVLHGVRKRNYENGKIKNVRANINGQIEGKWTEFYEIGQIKETGKYQHGKRIGKWQTFYNNGKLKSEGNYTNDKKTGIWKVYYYDGIEED